MKTKRITKITAIILILTVFMACSFTVFADEAAAATNTNNTQVTTNTSKSTTAKTAKMKKAAKKTYKTTKKATKKYNPTTVTNTDTKKVVKQKTIKTVTNTNYTKRLKTKKIKTVKTTITKTTTITKSAADTKATTVKELKAAATPNLIKAFDELGFKININTKVGYAGVFSATKHHIELKAYNVNTFLHEMGHFLACLKNKADKTADFNKIYNKEKSAYKGTNASYILANSSEYFAESYKEYVKEPKTLKNNRPATYAYIDNAVTGITDTDIARTNNQYNWAW